MVGDLNDSKRQGTITTYESQLKKYLVRDAYMESSTHESCKWASSVKCIQSPHRLVPPARPHVPASPLIM